MGLWGRLLLLVGLAVVLGGTTTHTARANSYGDAVAADNPLGWWRLDETSGSVSANSGSAGSALNGTYSNVTLGASGIAPDDSAVSLTGTGQVQLPASSLFEQTGPFSIEAWLKTTYNGTGSQQVYRTASTYGAMMVMDSGGGSANVGKLTFAFYDSSTTLYALTTPNPINDGSWHHIVGTYAGDGTRQLRLYLDGVLVSSMTYNNQIYYTAAGATIGAWGTNYRFQGSIDEFALYSSALSATRVAVHHDQSYVPPPPPPPSHYADAVAADSPVGWWRLGESSGDVAVDSGSAGASLNGTYSGVAPGAPGIVPDDGAVSFNANGHVQLPASSLFEQTGPFSIEAWLKTTYNGTNSQEVYRTASTYGVMMAMHAGGTAVGTLSFALYGGTTLYTLTTPNPINDGNWHHVVGTYSGDSTKTMKLYLDGAQVGSRTYTNSIYYTAAGATIGAWGTSYPFVGSIDEVALYPVALGADRVQAHYDGRWALSGADRQALLDAFRPEYRFSQTEPYRPASAALATDTFVPNSHTNTLLFEQSVIAASDPSQIIGTSDVLSLDYLATAPSGGIYPDNPRIDEGNVGGDQVDWSLNDYDYMLSQHPGQYNDVVYGRVVPDPQHTGQNILQYWVYYYYNQKTFYGAGEHEGDWELIQIHLDASGAPLSATYAQHGTPEKCGWTDVPISTGTHPIVWVADGSHASYFWPGDHSLPVWTEDTTGSLDSYYPETPAVIDVTDPPGWLLWDGQWGGSGDSPPSPSVQSAWTPFSWEPASPNCTSPPAPSPSRAAGSAPSGGVAAAPKGVIAPTLVVAPALPRFRARRDGDRVIVNYCFASMPSDARRRPWRIQLAVDNVSDSLPPATLSWAVTTRCGRIVDRVRYIKPSFVLRLSVRSRFGAESLIKTVKLK